MLGFATVCSDKLIAGCPEILCLLSSCDFVLQGNVFTFLQQSGGRLPESVVVPIILEPTMSALNYIHNLVSQHN